MRIVIPAVSSAHNPSGVCRHAANLARCLLKRSEISRIEVVVAHWQLQYFSELLNVSDDRLNVSPVFFGNSALARNYWYYRDLPRLAAGFQADIVHATYPVPLQRAGFACPVVATLHDLYPYDVPSNFGYPRVLINRLILWQCLAAVDAIACVSRGTLDKLAAFNPSLLRKASAIYNCVEPSSNISRLQISKLNHRPFLLTVGQHRRNKDLALTLRVFSRLLEQDPGSELMLLIVGNEGPETVALRSLIGTYGIHNRVVLLDGISDAELQWCYRSCEVLLATPTIEGFGLPVAEAALAGARIVCSDIPAFRELNIPGCRFVSLGSGVVDGFVKAISSARGMPKPKSSPIRRLSGCVISERYLRLYQGLLSNISRQQWIPPFPFGDVLTQEGSLR